MKKRRAHIAGDHASELFNPLPSSPSQKTTHPRRATRLDYACFTVHYNITLILHDKPLIFYKRPPPRPIWGEAGRNLPERVAIRGEKKCPTTPRRYDISFYPTFILPFLPSPSHNFPFHFSILTYRSLFYLFFPPFASLSHTPLSLPDPFITRRRDSGTLTAISRNVILLKHMSAWLIGRSTVRINNSARSPSISYLVACFPFPEESSTSIPLGCGN